MELTATRITPRSRKRCSQPVLPVIPIDAMELTCPRRLPPSHPISLAGGTVWHQPFGAHAIEFAPLRLNIGTNRPQRRLEARVLT